LLCPQIENRIIYDAVVAKGGFQFWISLKISLWKKNRPSNLGIYAEVAIFWEIFLI
jgi:hypothetical protein